MSDPNPSPSRLDTHQIFQRSFDEATDRLRMETEVTATITVAGNDVAIKDHISGNYANVNADGTLDVNTVISAAQGDSILMANTIVPVLFDSIYPTYPTDETEVYTYKQASSTVATVTVTYTDNTKAALVSIIRT